MEFDGLEKNGTNYTKLTNLGPKSCIKVNVRLKLRDLMEKDLDSANII